MTQCKRIHGQAGVVHSEILLPDNVPPRWLNRAVDEPEGFGKKVRDWNRSECLMGWRGR